jgi:flavin reductase (DIM6/NTAB) family NADH-FMN oxidoreductase RutF
MYIIGSTAARNDNASIANTVFQITSEPLTIAVSITRINLSYEYIRESKVFAVSVLSQDTPLSFIGKPGFQSGRDSDKLTGIKHKKGRTSAPVVVENTVSFFVARLVNQLDVGNHAVFIGEVVEAEVLSHKARLTYDYYRREKHGTTSGTAPSYVKE